MVFACCGFVFFVCCVARRAALDGERVVRCCEQKPLLSIRPRVSIDYLGPTHVNMKTETSDDEPRPSSLYKIGDTGHFRSKEIETLP